MAQQKGLGRGLGALLGDYNQGPEADGSLRQLPLQKVEPNPDQPRRDFNEEELQALADSIGEHGILQPLTVREMPHSGYPLKSLAIIDGADENGFLFREESGIADQKYLAQKI